MTKCTNIIVIAIVTLTLGQSAHLGCCTEMKKNVMPNSDKGTKVYSTNNLYSKNLKIIDIMISHKTDVYDPSNDLQNHTGIHKKVNAKRKSNRNTYYDVQYRERKEFNITRIVNWNTEPDIFSYGIDGYKNIQRKKVYNISAILDTVRNYHELIGIPLAKLVTRAKNKQGLKDNCRGRVAGGSQLRIGDFPFFVSMP